MIFLVCLTNSHNSRVREVKVKRMEWNLSCSFGIYIVLLKREKSKNFVTDGLYLGTTYSYKYGCSGSQTFLYSFIVFL